MPKSSRKKYTAQIEWGEFEGGAIVLPICPRSKAVNGRNFRVTLEALKEKATHLHIVLCDTLDRYNVGNWVDKTDKNWGSELQALTNGNDWLKENLPVIEEHFDSFDIKRWNEVRQHPDFDKSLALMRRLYVSNSNMRQIVDNVASHYLVDKEQRQRQRDLPFNGTLEKQRSVSYLLEEFAGDTVYNKWYKGLPEVYWGFYVGDPDIFNRVNTIDPSVDLSIPPTCAVKLNRLPPPISVEHQPKLS